MTRDYDSTPIIDLRLRSIISTNTTSHQLLKHGPHTITHITNEPAEGRQKIQATQTPEPTTHVQQLEQ